MVTGIDQIGTYLCDSGLVCSACFAVFALKFLLLTLPCASTVFQIFLPLVNLQVSLELGIQVSAYLALL